MRRSSESLSSDTPIVLRVSPIKFLLRALIFAGLAVILGAVVAGGGAGAFEWIGLIVSVALLVLTLGQVIGRSRLVITRGEFTCVFFPRRWSRDLASCSEFAVRGVPLLGERRVVFSHLSDDDRRGAVLVRRAVGHSSSLPDTFGMSAKKLAALLNDARASALTQPENKAP